MSGFVLVVAGILCLCLSGAVAATGSWWQATLDAFGVGFIVGGLIDVLAIGALNQIIRVEDLKRQNFNREAEWVLQRASSSVDSFPPSAVIDLLKRGMIYMDIPLVYELLRLLGDDELRNFFGTLGDKK